ncbi:MAG TPA: hypothetical protein VHA56_21115 [Mucilaginibacter sp.]|nr:hypothetical protein [Mucilaginibacter sp.]
MKNNIKNENPAFEITQIQANSADEYWSKKYGVSTEELKTKGANVSISSKILEAAIKNNVFSF